MKKNTSSNIRLGIFVLLGLVAFTFGIYRISEEQGLFRGGITIYSDFRDVKGLQTGHKVRFAGIHIGAVESVTIVNDTLLRVAMQVDQATTSYLRRNAETDIGTDGLVGNVVVNISAGNGNAPLVKDGDFLPRKQKAELPEMLETLAITNKAIEQISLNLCEITEKINSGEGSIARLLNDEDLAQTLANTTRNMEMATSRIYAATNSIEELMAGVTRGEGNLGYLLRDSSLEDQVARLSRELDSLIVIRTEPILENLAETSSELTLTVAEARELFTQLGSPDSPLGVLSSDTAAAEDLRTTLYHLEQSMQKFDENLQAMRSSWPFKRYFKKKEKGDQESLPDR